MVSWMSEKEKQKKLWIFEIKYNQIGWDDWDKREF